MALGDLFRGFALLTLVECAHEHSKKASHLTGGEEEKAREVKPISLLQASSHLVKGKQTANLPPIEHNLPPIDNLSPLQPLPPLGASASCPRRAMIKCGDEVDTSGKFEEPWKKPGCWISTPCSRDGTCMTAVDTGKEYSCSCPFRDEGHLQVFRLPVCRLNLGPLTPPKPVVPSKSRRRRRRRSIRRRRRRRTSKRSQLPLNSRPANSPIAPPQPPPPIVVDNQIPQPPPPIAPPQSPPSVVATETCPLENMIRCEGVDVSGRFEAPWTQAGCELSTPCIDSDVNACMAAGNTAQTYSCACPYRQNGKQVHLKPVCQMMIR